MSPLLTKIKIFFRYEREREQFKEFQQYSKELENEMEIELKQRDLKMNELEAAKRRLTCELGELKVF